jgi:site-specific DNA-cytosine methylase
MARRPPRLDRLLPLPAVQQRRGKQKGAKDARHLWPWMRHLLFRWRPAIAFGEQVASGLGRQWLAGVRANLETLGYAVGAADLCAAGVAAPHIRQRLWYAAQQCPPWLEADDFATEEETAVALVRGYARRYADDIICTYLAVELPFDLPIVNPETNAPTPLFRSGGKIDAIVELPDGRLALMEHKTTGDDISPGSDYWQRLKMDSQISRYYLAAKALGYDVQTTVYDVVRKPGIKPRNISKADRTQATHEGHYFGHPLTATCPERETPALYAARLLADLRERPDFYFARMEIPRLEADLDEFRWEQWAIQQTIRQAQRTGRFYRNTGACTSPYRCAYLDVCRGQLGDPNEDIPAGFRRVARLHEELASSEERNER